ncbi:MAG: hypothetical protein JW729_07995 [Bacteroidales bacterium]|nr:hypothetical protein [Bacteroidales bacterium]
MKTEENSAGYQAVEQDAFLKSLFNEDYLMSPSLNFTASILEKVQQREGLTETPAVSVVGKNITFLIFGLIALLNLVVLFIVWPYISVWLPEEGILRYLLQNVNTVFANYIYHIFTRTFSFSLLFIIALASFSLFGIDDYLRKRFHILPKSGYTS